MGEKCPCKGDYLDKFVQPAILSLLCEGPAHGFFLLAELEQRGLMSKVDATGFYRALRKLEEDGKLNSMWSIEAGEKPKKVYSITEPGLQCLQNWRVTLKAYIEHVVRIYEAADEALLMTGLCRKME